LRGFEQRIDILDRLKKVIDNKKKMIAEEEAIKAKIAKEQRAAEGLLEEEDEDADVIF